MSPFIRTVRTVSRWLCLVSAFLLAGMMFLTSSDVAARYFGHPIKGTYDMVGLLGGMAIALSIAYSQLNGKHVAMEFIASLPFKRIQTAIKTIACLLSIGMYALIAWQCTVFGTQLWETGRLSDTVRIPLFPFAYVVSLGFAVNCLVLLGELYNLLWGSFSKMNAINSNR